jgi:hypothetical protein
VKTPAVPIPAVWHPVLALAPLFAARRSSCRARVSAPVAFER